jgi:biotin-dependent carboxylase-like uncharacterized protein
MIPGLKVILPGTHTAVQDSGRVGYRDVGVPISGPLDRVSLALANALVGNSHGEAALEIALRGPILEVTATSARLALVGGERDLRIEIGDGRSCPSGQSIRLRRGDRMHVAPSSASPCAYLALEGGFDLPSCLGSISTYRRGGIGGIHGRALQSDDIVPLRVNDVPLRNELGLRRPYDPGHDQTIRVVLGPQQDCFLESAITTLVSEEFAISLQSDRMAFRLDGPKLAHLNGYNMVSDGIVPGSIQVLGSGQPVVLLADAQTIGGYPKIATVISTDLPVLARRPPASPVRFAVVTREEAEALRRQQDQALDRCIRDFQPLRAPAHTDLAALYSSNLIDGVVDARDALPG